MKWKTPERKSRRPPVEVDAAAVCVLVRERAVVVREREVALRDSGVVVRVEGVAVLEKVVVVVLERDFGVDEELEVRESEVGEGAVVARDVDVVAREEVVVVVREREVADAGREVVVRDVVVVPATVGGS